MQYAPIVISLCALILSAWRASKSDSEAVARMAASLDAMKEDLLEIKAGQAATLEKVSADHDDIVRLQMSVNAIWRRIDHGTNQSAD